MDTNTTPATAAQAIENNPFQRKRKERRKKPPMRTSFTHMALRPWYPVFFFPTAAAFVLGFLAPFLFGIWLSFFRFRTVENTVFCGFDNYLAALRDRQFWYSFGFTAIFTVLTVVFVNVFAFAIAYVLTRGIKGTNLFRTVFFLPNLIGGIVLGFIWQILLNGVFRLWGENVTSDPSNAFWGLVILTCWQQIGYMMIIYIAGLQSVPEQLIEAAKIDGATPSQTLFRITIPMVRSSVTICTFLTLTNSFKLYDQNAALITGGNPSTVLPDGSTIHQAATIARNIVDQFSETYLSANGIAQAKSVIFFLFVVVISLAQLAVTRRGEVQQ